MTDRNEDDGAHLGFAPSESDKEAPGQARYLGETFVAPSTRVAVRTTRLDTTFSERYRRHEIIGRGGMGEIWLCTDERIGRDVAMKSIRAGASDGAAAMARFELEARVQAQLEHPAVVPVYDLGVTPERDVYFTMRRVRGRTLMAVIEGLRREAGSALRPFGEVYSRHKLLAAFNQLCLAVDYAHARGIIHRDLKPANVMLGSYGEVHLLDWGIAKLVYRVEARSGPTVTWSSEDTWTRDGEEIGTPGYMAPEQGREGGAVDERADVFALGAILFEILTLEPLRPLPEKEDDPLGEADPRASVRAPHREVPPELEAICVKATAPSPADRFRTARELYEAVERFLDGDRDVQLRKSLAEKHVRSAEEAAARAWDPGPEGADARSRALREIGAALTLDPSNPDALDALEQLLDRPHASGAQDVEAGMEAASQSARRSALRARLAGLSFAGSLLLLALSFGLRDTRAFAVAAACVAFAVVATVVLLLRKHVSENAARWRVVIGALPAIALSAWMGPFMLVPTIAAVNATVAAAFATPTFRRLTLAGSVLAIIGPYAAQAAGWMAPSYLVRDDMILILPRMTGFPPHYTLGALLVAHVVLIVLPAIGVGKVRDEVRSAEERLVAMISRARQLLPEEAYEPVARVSHTPSAPPASGRKSGRYR